MIELQPGKTAWPYHYHLANEEAIYVLEGEATLRLGDKQHRVRAGHYVALPCSEDHAHQMTNTSSAVCRYLVISTMQAPEVCIYPDSDKVGVIAGTPPGRSSPDALRLFFPRQTAVGYWDGEPVGDPEAAAREREEQLEQEIDEEIGAMKEKLGLDRLATASARVRARIEEKVDTLRAAVGRRIADPDDEADEKLEPTLRVVTS
ncbi:MAG: cupin domain-containing protein [Actinomycetota bacterium]